MFKKTMLMLCALGSMTLTQAKEVELFVKEMNCQLCVYLVNKELRALESVQKTKGDMQRQTVKVVLDDDVDPQTLVQTLSEKLHYHAEIVSTEK